MKVLFLRVEDELHDKLTEQAKADGRSLNVFSIRVLQRHAYSPQPSMAKHEVILPDGGRALVIPRKVAKKLQNAKPGEAVDVKADEITSPKFCPNGHSIPAGRTKCLGKGCKYA